MTVLASWALLVTLGGLCAIIGRTLAPGTVLAEVEPDEELGL